MPKIEETIELILKKLQLKQENCIKLQDEIIALEEEKAIKKEKLQEIQTLLMRGKNAKEKKELLIKTLDLVQKNKTLKEENKDKLTLEHILNKLDSITTNDIKTDIQEVQSNNFDLEEEFENFLEHRTNFDRIGVHTIRTTKSAFRYLKYFTNQDTIFNFSFFKEVQKKFQHIPANFFKFEKYYTKKYEEVLKLKKEENYETLNNKTINEHMSKYRTFFDYLVYEQKIKENPLDNIKSLPEEKETNKEEYTQEELEKIFNTKLGKTYLDLYRFALYTGLRIGEILSIRKEDIKDNFIYLNLKDSSTKKHERIIPVHKNIIDLIEYHKKHNKSAYLFFNFEKENEVKNVGKRLNSRLQKIVPNATMKNKNGEEIKKSLHSFRKNFSQEIEMNTNAEYVVKHYLMGHIIPKDITHHIYNRGKVNTQKLQDCINQITFKY